MNDTVWVITAVVTLALAALALGTRLGNAWGVDASRETPGEEKGCAVSGSVLLALLLVCLLAPAALWARLEKSLYGAIAGGGVLALLGGTAAYASTFAGMRNGGADTAGLARAVLSGAACRAVYLLEFLASASFGALMLRAGAAALGLLPAQQAQPWMGACAAVSACALLVRLCGAFSGRIRAEGEAAPLCMGGAGIAALFFAALCAARETGMTLRFAAYDAVLRGAFALCCAGTGLACVLLGAASLAGLFARERLLRKPRRTPRWLWLIPCAAVTGAAALAPLGLMAASGVLGGAYVLCAFALCWLWLGRIGRAWLL